jgi:hypothetical protein
MATKLSVINNLMRRLREPEVASSDATPYATLIASIVTEAYEEVLDEWNWRPVSEFTVMELDQGSTLLVPDINNVKVGPIPDGRMVLTREHGTPYVRVYGGAYTPDKIFNESGFRMEELTLRDYGDILGKEILQEGEYPTSFTIRPKPDESVEFYFWQPSYQTCTVTMNFYRRPGRLTSDESTDDTEFDIPFRPVQELALMYALNERGEEMGEPGNLAQGRYIQALAAAKEIDLKAGEYSDKYDWGRD